MLLFFKPTLFLLLSPFIAVLTIFNISSQESKHRKFFSRSASLRQAGSGGGGVGVGGVVGGSGSHQASMELHVPGQEGRGTSSGAGSPQTQTQPSTPKKSNWEVIEHFNTSAKGGKAVVSSSLIAVSSRGFWNQLICPPNGQNVDGRLHLRSPSTFHPLWDLNI